MKRVILIAGPALALAACAASPPPTDANSRLLPPDGGAAAIYITRGLDPVVLAGAPVRLDGQQVASLRRHDYVRLDVPPGQHRVGCGDSDTAHVVDVAPGRAAFVEALLRVGWMGPLCSLLPLDDVNGRQRVLDGTPVRAGQK
jgi:hypothetical protein